MDALRDLVGGACPLRLTLQGKSMRRLLTNQLGVGMGIGGGKRESESGKSGLWALMKAYV